MSEELTVAESLAVSEKMARYFRQRIEFFRRELKWSVGKAEQKATQEVTPSEQAMARIADTALDELGWLDFLIAEMHTPEQGNVLWEKVKQFSQEQWTSGRRGADALLDRLGTPSDLAEYLTLREELGRGWQPSSGIEQALIDQMTQAYLLYLRWLYTANARMLRDARTLTETEQIYDLPHVSDQEAEVHAVEMADRWHRMFLRSLRALRELRRYAPPVIVQNAGQVNVGAQQVNVAQTDGPQK